MMKTLFRVLLWVALITTALTTVVAQENSDAWGQQERGVVVNETAALQGYTLVSPLRSTTTYLVDMGGKVVHQWKSTYTPGYGVHVLSNGNLLRSGRDDDNPHFQKGGQGGRIQEIAWDGEVVWEFVYSSSQHVQHHDIEPLPNGNVLILAWERKTAQQALVVGRDPQFLSGLGMWPDHLVEVKPIRPRGGEVVWEWHVWDHLIQDRSPKLRNYGKVEDHPELVDINGDLNRQRETDEEMARLRALGYVVDSPQQAPPGDRSRETDPDWNHTNSVAYHEGFDQIVLSVHHFNEIWVIDHSTTSEQAAGHSGGKGGRGGDLLYRWGNPQAYRAGSPADQQLFGQHDVRWIPGGFPGAGNLTLFNNGRGRPGGEYSSVDEVDLPRDSSGRYRVTEKGSFVPARIVWSYSGTEQQRFYSGHISGAERLSNGNTLICDGEQGRVFEVTPQGKIVWDFLNPLAADIDLRDPSRWTGAIGITGTDPIQEQFGLLRASRLSPDDPGLSRLR